MRHAWIPKIEGCEIFIRFRRSGEGRTSCLILSSKAAISFFGLLLSLAATIAWSILSASPTPIISSISVRTPFRFVADILVMTFPSATRSRNVFLPPGSSSSMSTTASSPIFIPSASNEGLSTSRSVNCAPPNNNYN